jgi:hypothetical protein
MQKEQSEYTLPQEIIEVRDIYRRTTGISSGTGNNIEPFQAAYMNTYLLGSSRNGGLATFDFLQQNRETMGRLFGAEIMFTWRPQENRLILHRKIKAPDTAVLHVYMHRIDEDLITDTYAGPWIKDYSFAHARLMLAEARGKFTQIAGPQGGTTMNADQLRTDALQEIDKLETELTVLGLPPPHHEYDVLPVAPKLVPGECRVLLCTGVSDPVSLEKSIRDIFRELDIYP